MGVLFGALVVLILLSAFFSGSETGLMTLNRYRLRHLAKAKHPGAMRAQKLLDEPDRLIGLILLGNNFVNIFASSLATIIAIELAGDDFNRDAAITIAAVILTLIILIFAEVTPKTLAALHPEKVAYRVSYIFGPMLKLFYPLVFAVNFIANGILHLLRIKTENVDALHLNSEELRTVVNEAGKMIPQSHQKMLISILDLEKATVEDIMIPRNEITGINYEDPWSQIEEILINSPYTKLPLYRNNIDKVIGFIHLRDVIRLSRQQDFHKEKLIELASETYFIPEGTSLNTQLLNFQRSKARVGLVVNEYGDIQGLVTMEDILEEIVGEFTTDPTTIHQDITPQDDGSFLIDGGAHIREINRTLSLELPAKGPKTLNGLIIEHMETIPRADTSILIAGYPIEVKQIMDNTIKTVRIYPLLRKVKPEEESDTE